jgi:hypothetical protein
MARIDHVVLAVRDLEASAERLWEQHGLCFVPGGRHPQWGTANMIAPLGDDYLELLGVVDEDIGTGTVLGRTLMELSADGDRWFSVCVATGEIEAVAARLGLRVEPGGRARPDGTEVRWRGAGIEERAEELWLPFFIDWDVPDGSHPGAAPAAHRVPAEGIAWVEVGGDRERLDAWLGDISVPIRVVHGGDPGVHVVAVAVREGEEIVLEG